MVCGEIVSNRHFHVLDAEWTMTEQGKSWCETENGLIEIQAVDDERISGVVRAAHLRIIAALHLRHLATKSICTSQQTSGIPKTGLCPALGCTVLFQMQNLCLRAIALT